MNMKKSILAVMTGLLTMISCTTEETPVNEPMVKGSIQASFEKSISSSRLSIGEGNVLTWSAGDTFVMFNETGASETWKLEGNGGNELGTFLGNTPEGTLKGAAFPSSAQPALSGEILTMNLPETVTYAEGICNLPMWASVSSVKENVSFKHLAALLKINFADIPEGYNTLTVTADKHLSGTFTADLSLEEPVLEAGESGSNTVSVSFTAISGSDNDRLFYLPLPVGEYKSLNISISNGENTVSIADWKDRKIVRKKVYLASICPDYLTFSCEAEQTLTMSQAVETLEYSVNNGEWTELGTTTVVFGGDKGNLRLRGMSATGTANYYNSASIAFGNECDVEATGDIRTLVDYKSHTTANTSDARFCGLFANCTYLTSAPKLPATTLANYCYYSMFYGCSSLKEAPALPATTLAENCYYSMFYGCSNLTSAPALPATTLANNCYCSMFYGCSSLTSAPALPATTLAGSCYTYMFSNCSSLKETPALPATKLTNYCYYGMFRSCSNLTSASALPATTLAESCYSSMFYGCSSLQKAPELPATTLAPGCYTYMFFRCSSLTSAPELPAATLVDWCYNGMFYGCSQLNHVTMLATDISASDCLYYWLYGVSSTGTFVKASSMESLPEGSSGIPSGWTVKNYGE